MRNPQTGEPINLIWYDYTSQAWVIDGVYASCGHPPGFEGTCYACDHTGETPSPEIVAKYGNPGPQEQGATP